jgi:hypothetical protein
MLLSTDTGNFSAFHFSIRCPQRTLVQHRDARAHAAGRRRRC